MGKVKNWDQARQFCDAIRSKGKVVFTNGVFDILHRGHIEYLTDARNLGDALIVGLNTDASARRLSKGPGRPVNNQDDRAVVLAALEMIDVVVMFDQDTPRELISHLKPDVLVKGGDYRIEDIVGYQEVRSWGGEVKVIPFRTGCSTSSLYERIRKLPKE